MVIVSWFVVLGGSLFRKDLKRSGTMWFVLSACVPFAFYFYFFLENRKVWGYISAIASILLLVVLFLPLLR